MAEERLQKVLARAGIASRRASESLITEGRVSVDGRVVRELGVRVDARASRIEVDGRRLVAEPFVYVVLHKPRGVMCTLSDPEGRPTVAELLRDVGVRVVPIGRLDFHTSGALLCSNDGEFAGKLLHPRGKVPKEYVAKVRGVLDERGLERWRESILIDGRATQPAEVRLLRVEGDKSWLSIILKEGRNRQVRRLGEATGNEVLRLVRVAHAGITADKLLPGQWRHLTREELKALKQAHGVPRRVHTPPELDQFGGRIVRSSTARTTSTKKGKPRAAREEGFEAGRAAGRSFARREEGFEAGRATGRSFARREEAQPSEFRSTRSVSRPAGPPARSGRSDAAPGRGREAETRSRDAWSSGKARGAASKGARPSRDTRGMARSGGTRPSGGSAPSGARPQADRRGAAPRKGRTR